MSLVQLESFVVVAEEGNLRRAAGRLHVSQPPLTRRIRALEEELGVSLFERTRSGMQLLPTGHRFLDHARIILGEVDRARHTFRDRNQDPSRTSENPFRPTSSGERTRFSACP